MRACKHGLSFSPEYSAWKDMRRRCANPKSRNYPHYGGRGIRVCDVWATDFRAFYRDMGARPSSDHSLDRIDNDGNYEPGNCRWATQAEQMRNLRKTVLVSLCGEALCFKDACQRVGLPYTTGQWRRVQSGWSPAFILMYGVPAAKRAAA